ncbi:tetratricopeptide repeat protein [Magnetospirillum molischianum]|uniref:Ancillary SecYEG translocon subunit n=1 Tax=Magnetospirillum molischianum DSM 120 TaxID=1150626 RepID=H8FV91_MAGML|nr:tetratricopeptide repeat protein [Magnetospirillum molischianum]CCG42279.1 conserved hypothetical protein [Magnetospirillum molischianum DSM 120]
MNEKQQHDAAADLLIKEVDEDLRHEQLANLWKRHGILVVGFGVAAILAVAGWQGWRAWDGQQRKDSSQRFHEIASLLEQGKRDEAVDDLTRLASEGASGYRLLANLRLADLRQQQGDPAAAASIYRAVAADGSVAAVYRDMASIRAAYLTLDVTDPAQLDKAMEPLAVESSSWRHSAREIQALTALRRGDKVRAAELFSRLAEDAAAPEGMRTRAAEMLAVTGQADRG